MVLDVFLLHVDDGLLGVRRSSRGGFHQWKCFPDEELEFPFIVIGPCWAHVGLGPFGEVCGRCRSKALRLGTNDDDASRCCVPLVDLALASLPTNLVGTQGKNPRPC